MSEHSETPEHDHLPNGDEYPVPELEFDQDVAPRPEEEAADALRSTPEPDGVSENETTDADDASD